ncbi:hypothetical protein AAC387_Pa10g0825 [Persea americana]
MVQQVVQQFDANTEAVLPDSNLVLESIYAAKNILHDLGLGYEHIDACENDCTLFWKENVGTDKCSVCRESRYRVNVGKGKKIPHKVLGYFPLIPRHPAYCDEWKDLDKENPDFSVETRNIRMGLASDGFDPFGDTSTSYSMWPIILMPYNLPPWMCMKEPFFMMSLLIPRPRQPGNDIDVYLRPMIDELKEL